MKKGVKMGHPKDNIVLTEYQKSVIEMVSKQSQGKCMTPGRRMGRPKGTGTGRKGERVSVYLPNATKVTLLAMQAEHGATGKCIEVAVKAWCASEGRKYGEGWE